ATPSTVILCNFATTPYLLATPLSGGELFGALNAPKPMDSFRATTRRSPLYPTRGVLALSRGTPKRVNRPKTRIRVRPDPCLLPNIPRFSATDQSGAAFSPSARHQRLPDWRRRAYGRVHARALV